MNVREANIEGYLRDRVRDVGGLCIKLAPAGYVGIPDRLLVLPGGRIVFVECKKPKGGRVARLQEWWRDTLLGLGFPHRFVFTREDVDQLIREFS